MSARRAMRVAAVTGKSSCTGLTPPMPSGLSTRPAMTRPVRPGSSQPGLRQKNLSDLINFTGPGWRTNSLIVYAGGTVYGATTSSVWWQNPVTVDYNGGSLAAAGTIYVVTNGALAVDYTINASSVGLVAQPGVMIKGSGGGAYSNVIKADGSTGGARDFLWIEGKVDAAGENGIYLNTVRFSVLRNVKADNASMGYYYLPSGV